MSSAENPKSGQNTSGFRSALSLAPAYRLTQWALGANRVRRVFADDYVKVKPADRVLDLGCGTADILDLFPAVDYIGFDPSERYVSDARRRYPNVGVFTSDADDLRTVTDRTVVMAIGVLHHMTDGEAVELISRAIDCLTPGGRFVSIDPTLVNGQRRMARALIVRDRGQQVRSPVATKQLIESVFSEVEVVVRHDLLRFPYSHVLTMSTKQAIPEPVNPLA